MPLVPSIFLTDNSGQQWFLTVSNSATPTQVPVTNQPSSVPFLYLNGISDGLTYQISIIGNPPPTGKSWGDINTIQVAQGNYPTQLLVTAPNGTVYAFQVATVVPPQVGVLAQGTIQVALPLHPYSCDSLLSDLSQNVLERLEDPTGIFWLENFEVNAGLVEAFNETLMLVGRPTQIVASPFNLTPNTPYQTLPKGILLATDIQGPQSQLRKVSLWDMDYSQSSWGADWENDTSDSGPVRWFPLGYGMFGVHPACTAPQTVLLDGIAYPVTTPYPYDGGQIVPFEHHWFQMFEQYSSVYCRLKEGTQEFQESLPMLQAFYSQAARMTDLQDRRDPVVFSNAFGGTIGVNQLKRR